jgi:predicted nucleic acid-binding protein
MADSIFLDANIPMYAAGRVHPLKQPCIDVLSLAAHHPARFITDAEVFQEILHRYRAIGRWHDGEQLFRKFIELMRGQIADVLVADVAQWRSRVERPGSI